MMPDRTTGGMAVCALIAIWLAWSGINSRLDAAESANEDTNRRVQDASDEAAAEAAEAVRKADMLEMRVDNLESRSRMIVPYIGY